MMGSGAMASLMAMSDGTGFSSCSGLSWRGILAGGAEEGWLAAVLLVAN